MKLINIESVRFIVVGGVGTILTYLVYLFLLTFLTYQIAYSVTYGLGIVLSYTLNTFIVFREPWAWKKMLQFPVVYLFQYLLGLMIVSALVEYFVIDQRVAPLLVVVLLLPATFVMSRWVIRRSK
jgi:putative flippase GtrA